MINDSRKELSKKGLQRLIKNVLLKIAIKDFPGDAVVKNLLANAGDMGSSPGPGRSHMPRIN